MPSTRLKNILVRTTTNLDPLLKSIPHAYHHTTKVSTEAFDECGIRLFSDSLNNTSPRSNSEPLRLDGAVLYIDLNSLLHNPLVDQLRIIQKLIDGLSSNNGNPLPLVIIVENINILDHHDDVFSLLQQDAQLTDEAIGCSSSNDSILSLVQSLRSIRLILLSRLFQQSDRNNLITLGQEILRFFYELISSLKTLNEIFSNPIFDLFHLVGIYCFASESRFPHTSCAWSQIAASFILPAQNTKTPSFSTERHIPYLDAVTPAIIHALAYQGELISKYRGDIRDFVECSAELLSTCCNSVNIPSTSSAVLDFVIPVATWIDEQNRRTIIKLDVDITDHDDINTKNSPDFTSVDEVTLPSESETNDLNTQFLRTSVLNAFVEKNALDEAFKQWSNPADGELPLHIGEIFYSRAKQIETEAQRNRQANEIWSRYHGLLEVYYVCLCLGKSTDALFKTSQQDAIRTLHEWQSILGLQKGVVPKRQRLDNAAFEVRFATSPLNDRHVDVDAKDTASRQQERNSMKQYTVKPEDRSIDYISNAQTEISEIIVGTSGVIVYTDQDGVILGPQQVGASAMICFGRATRASSSDSLHTGAGVRRRVIESGLRRAVRLPRLNTGDRLLNYGFAETCFYENQQASTLEQGAGLCKAIFASALNQAVLGNRVGEIKEQDGTFVGFYVGSGQPLRIGVISEHKAWPADLADLLKPDGVQHLWRSIVNTRESVQKGVPLVYLPIKNRIGQSDEEGKPVILLRDELELAYQSRDVAGWFFSVPAGVYPWMEADLERMLADLRERGFGKDGSYLGNLSITEWLQILTNLGRGLVNLHKESVHGDVRPANVMREAGVGAGAFQWIDVGGGYTARSGRGGKSGQVGILGTGRKTAFYAPERAEIVQTEDADVVHVEKLGGSSGKGERDQYLLRFLYKSTTGEPPRPIRIGRDGLQGAGSRLARLRCGDQLQIETFLFDVESVEMDGIIVNRAYKIYNDKLLLEEKLAVIFNTMPSIPVSRYGLAYQWGQAADIYGFGLMVMYMFFMRGAAVLQKGVEGFSAEGAEEAFKQLVEVLRNESFLDSFLSFVHNTDGNPDYGAFEDKDDLFLKIDDETVATISSVDGFGEECLSAKQKNIFLRLRQIIDRTWWLDANLKFLYFGVNSSAAMFVLVLYFTLLCVWRRDEVNYVRRERLSRPWNEIKFEPYADSRVRLGKVSDIAGVVKNNMTQEQPEAAAVKAAEDLGRLIELLPGRIRGGKINPVAQAVPVPIAPGDQEKLKKLPLMERIVHLEEANIRLMKAKADLEEKFRELDGGLKNLSYWYEGMSAIKAIAKKSEVKRKLEELEKMLTSSTSAPSG